MMILVLILSAAVFAHAEARAVPAPANPKAVPKGADQLLNELKFLEKGRQEALKHALENPKFKADPRMMEFLSVLSSVDSLFVEYHNYYSAMNTLIRSDEKSTPAHEALATIKRCRQKSIELANTVNNKAKKLQPLSAAMDSQLDFLDNIFDNTLEKNEEIEEQLRSAFHSSSFTKYMKHMPVMPTMAET